MSDIDTGGAAGAAKAAGFGRKLGPLPIWAWAVAVVALVAVIYFVFRRSAGAPSATMTGTGVSGAASQTAAGVLSTLYGTGSKTGYQSAYSNQSAWESAAIAEIPGSTSYTPLQVQDALNSYTSNGLSGLTTSQQGIINQIISALGPNPESVPGNVPGANLGNPTGFFQYVGSNQIQGQYANGVVSPLSSADLSKYSPTSVNQVSAYGNPFSRYEQNILGGTVYGIDTSGNTEALTGAQFSALGNPFGAVKYDNAFNPNVKQANPTGATP